MSKEHAEHISIIMEIVAFFLVTIDLYGKTRLRDFALQINQIDIKNLKIKNVYKISKFIVILCFIYGCFATIFIVAISSLYVNDNLSEHNTVKTLITGVVIPLALMGLTINYLQKIYRLTGNMIVNILKFALWLFRYMLSLFPIEGVMLTIGSVLFISAKLILFFYI